MSDQNDIREGWIIAGELDGVPARPRLLDDVCGIPHVLRLACDLALAGATKITVIWNESGPLPDLASVAADPRLASRAKLEVLRAAPTGAAGDLVVVARADRMFHRDMPKLAISASRRGTVGKIEGDEHDAVFATDRATAARLVGQIRAPRGLASALSRDAAGVVEVPPPYAGFTARVSGPGSLAHAERQLVWSLRKSADGIASKALNRPLSLRLTLRLARTKILPNHITLVALALALFGGIVIARGGYAAGLAGMLLVNLGSIIDGCDGELARLRFQFSRTGEWLDTVVDDIANVAYVSGVIASLVHADHAWALPVGASALVAFAITQSTQYALIRFVYRSGDLAAIPWAFQSSGFLSQRPVGVRAWFAATLPKCLKRDFVLTLFVLFALVGRLDLVLLGFSAGAFAFFAVFVVQLARNWGSVHRALRIRATPQPATVRA